MKNLYSSMITKGLIIIVAILLSTTLMGCHDQGVADMEAQHRQLGLAVQQELQQCRSTFPPSAKTEALYPAP